MTSSGSPAANGNALSCSRVEKVMQHVRERIQHRTLSVGARLPSIRTMAQLAEVSKSTVVDAYDRLVAEGLVQSRPGAGFYVRQPLPPFSLSVRPSAPAREVDPLWVMRQSLAADEKTLNPGCGWLPATWMPENDIRKALRALSRQPVAPLTAYGTPQGSPELRQLLALRMSERGILSDPACLVLTESGTQALDLICRFLLDRGDTVLVDDPCFFNFHAMLRAHRAQVISVPFTPTGPDLAVFAQQVEQHRPRLYLTNAALHNPTGATISPATAHRVLQIAEQYDMTIVEDDVFADFEQQPSPRMAAMDGLRRVIHTGSFSKSLSASVRCGYIAARPDWIDGLVDMKLATAFEAGHFSAELLLKLLSSGAYRRHMEGVRARLSDAMHLTTTRLETAGLTLWTQPSAGMFVWAKLPEGLSAQHIAQSALEDGVVLAPGNAFSLSHQADAYLRFNVAQSTHPRVMQVLEKAMAETTSLRP